MPTQDDTAAIAAVLAEMTEAWARHDGFAYRVAAQRCPADAIGGW